jgi:hypothetical protein
MSMQLYALCLHPLFTLLYEKVARLQIGRNGRRIAAVAYADDVTFFLTPPKDPPIIKDIIHTFEKASGGRLNPHKSKALAIAGWDATDTGLGIDFQPSIKILGITFPSTIARSAQLCWEPMTSLIQAQARLAYGRKLCIAQRVQNAAPNVNSGKLPRDIVGKHPPWRKHEPTCIRYEGTTRLIRYEQSH